jgi:hypothetical protein
MSHSHLVFSHAGTENFFCGGDSNRRSHGRRLGEDSAKTWVARPGRMIAWLSGCQDSLKHEDNIWKRVGGDHATVFLRPDGTYVGVFRGSFTRRYDSQIKAQLALYHLTIRPNSDLDSQIGNQGMVLPVSDVETLPW